MPFAVVRVKALFGVLVLGIQALWTSTPYITWVGRGRYVRLGQPRDRVDFSFPTGGEARD